MSCLRVEAPDSESAALLIEAAADRFAPCDVIDLSRRRFDVLLEVGAEPGRRVADAFALVAGWLSECGLDEATVRVGSRDYTMRAGRAWPVGRARRRPLSAA